MKKYILLFLPLIIPAIIFSQSASITFKKEKDTVRRAGDEVIRPVTIIMEKDNFPQDDKENYKLTIKVDEAKTTLSHSAYTLNFNTVTLDKITGEYKFYLSVNKDAETDRTRYIFLDIGITKDGEQANINSASSGTSMVITVESARSINSYNYLAYVGTNFDLVDGVQAKNLFFATNLMSAPVKTKGIGFTLTLYGNRTTTSTDTTGRVTYTSKVVPIGGDSARFYTESALKTVNRVSDNLGASFSPLLRLGGLSDPGNIVQFYYAPQFEFVWRRTKITTKYSDASVVDSTDMANRPFSRPIVLTEPVSVTPLNVYDVYLGLAGIMMNHENKFVSVRVQAAVGWNFSYISGRGSGGTRSDPTKTTYARVSQAFLFTRAWITEPISGITIGAEVSNTLFKNENSQPYYNVTLSKAINLSSLAGIFQPVATR